MAELPRELTCKICLVARCNTLVAPCGHLVACLECMDRMPRLVCPVCMGFITDVLLSYST